MKLRKEEWKEVKIEQICEFVRGPFGGSLKKEIFVKEGYAIYEQQHAINNQFNTFRYFIDENKFNEMKRFQVLEGDIIMSCSGTFGKIAIIPKNTRNGIINQALLKLRCKNELNNSFFQIWLNSQSFQKEVNSSVQGTAIKNIASIAFYKQIQIQLPPLEEQKQIAALFQSIETAIEQVEGQEKKLNTLQKTLSNGLVSKSPVWGNLLSDKNCNLCTFEDITDCIEEHDKKPLKSGITRFVGLEFIEAENFNLQGFGDIEKGTTFTKRFSKGDVLFGKRRAYLKKVAVADFDGICSSDILVFRANKTKMLPELLPYYVSSETFINHAVSTSAGSLSPRTKWNDLSVLEVSIPDLKAQEKIVEVFQQLQLTLDQLKQQKTTLKNLKQKLLSEILG
ncbi:MAG: restriction endonuclease subunit S [Proteobacteria bacterium]|nr:restriction endonuclease subunit S [Pseudomonadota bacterium]